MKIVLCADDYAFNESVSNGIIDLASKQRLSAISCMTTTPHWGAHAKQLLSLKNKVDIGLHFNLTTGQQSNSTQSLPTLKSWLIKTHLRWVSKQAIYSELQRQIDCFAEALGYLPDFIDGHEHVHQFPVVRDALLDVYEKRLSSNQTYIRISSNGFFNSLRDSIEPFKATIISLSGAMALKKRLQQCSIPHNTSFAGIYGFQATINYANLFPKFLEQIKNNGLIMCHPGLLSDDSKDSIRHSRWQEYNYFISDEFATLCKNVNIEITRFNKSGFLTA